MDHACTSDLCNSSYIVTFDKMMIFMTDCVCNVIESSQIVMSSLRASEEEEQWQSEEWGNDADEQMRGMYDSNWDLWEEWMGWEGAGIRDYSSHINPYI